MIFHLAKKSTLIVEDFAEFARSVRAMLHTMGATMVDIVYNAEDAIKACKDKKYDVILSDYNLGSKKDGQQLLEELLKYKLIRSNCVFLMLTAENTTAMVMGAVEYQPDGYIAKPFNGNLLNSRLQKAIERKDALQPINRAIDNKQWQQALDEINTLNQSNPKYRMSGLRLKYSVLKALKKLDAALELVSKIVDQRPIPWALEAVGEVYYLQGRLDKALGIFNNMINEFPMALEGYDWLARTQKQLGQTIEAQSTLSKAVKKSPKSLQRQKNLGSLAEQNNDIVIMTQAYRSAVKYGTNSAFSSADEYIKLTTALSKQIEQESEVIQDKVIAEAELTFEKLNRSFPPTSSQLLRSNIAQAAFYKASGNQDKTDKHLNLSEKHFKELDEQVSATISLELSTTLNLLGKSELADEIINEAIQQNLDDADFIEKASSITSDSTLIKTCKQAGQHNNKAIYFFKNKKYSDAITWFDKAHKLTPSNINIRLNYVQSLLKQAQKNSNPLKDIEKADKIITEMSQLAFSDFRYARFSELTRLTQLMLQQEH